jgi:hypothetical protein
VTTRTERTGLRRFAERPAPVVRAAPVERCEMCGTEVADRHAHVVDLEHRSLMCACRACYLLFTRPDAGRYRAVPERYLTDPSGPLAAPEWERLGIPVASAFFLRGADGTAAFYPSPAGATECLLDLAAWADLVATRPLLAAAEPDVEAILVRDRDCYLVPIDACYQLVGLVRKYWKGFDGGEEAREHIDAFFADLRARARPFRLEG